MAGGGGVVVSILVSAYGTAIAREAHTARGEGGNLGLIPPALAWVCFGGAVVMVPFSRSSRVC